MGSGPFGDARLYRSGRYHHGFFPLAASINSFMASHGRTLWRVFFISIAWAIWAYGGIEATGLSWWNLLWLFPVLIPFGTLSKRRWSDFDAKPGAPAD